MIRPVLIRPILSAAALTAAAFAGLAGPSVAKDHAPGVDPNSNPEAYHFLHQEGYVHLNAPLYAAPVQHVPIQVGGTMITNPAFAPHEYLYPHDYSAMYGPFYHRARGTWAITPWGVRTNERWDLVGTEVNVKYRSKIPFFAGFNPVNRRETFFDNEWSNTTTLGSPVTKNFMNRH